MSDRQVQLPDKLYFRIGEVAALVGVKPYVLRYWESEFSIVRPTKSHSKHRLYRRRDVETLLQIKRLLHDERFTIEGARKQLKARQQEEREHRGGLNPATRAYRTILASIKEDIQYLQRMLR